MNASNIELSRRPLTETEMEMITGGLHNITQAGSADGNGGSLQIGGGTVTNNAQTGSVGATTGDTNFNFAAPK